jgi:hypothetical protein
MVDEGGERRLAHTEMLQFHRRENPSKRPFPAPSNTGAMMIVSSSNQLGE